MNSDDATEREGGGRGADQGEDDDRRSEAFREEQREKANRQPRDPETGQFLPADEAPPDEGPEDSDEADVPGEEATPEEETGADSEAAEIDRREDETGGEAGDGERTPGEPGEVPAGGDQGVTAGNPTAGDVHGGRARRPAPPQPGQSPPGPEPGEPRAAGPGTGTRPAPQPLQFQSTGASQSGERGQAVTVQSANRPAPPGQFPGTVPAPSQAGQAGPVQGPPPGQRQPRSQGPAPLPGQQVRRSGDQSGGPEFTTQSDPRRRPPVPTQPSQSPPPAADSAPSGATPRQGTGVPEQTDHPAHGRSGTGPATGAVGDPSGRGPPQRPAGSGRQPGAGSPGPVDRAATSGQWPSTGQGPTAPRNGPQYATGGGRDQYEQSADARQRPPGATDQSTQVRRPRVDQQSGPDYGSAGYREVTFQRRARDGATDRGPLFRK